MKACLSRTDHAAVAWRAPALVIAVDETASGGCAFTVWAPTVKEGFVFLYGAAAENMRSVRLVSQVRGRPSHSCRLALNSPAGI